MALARVSEWPEEAITCTGFRLAQGLASSGAKRPVFLHSKMMRCAKSDE